MNNKLQVALSHVPTEPLDYQGQRVLTLRNVDEIHQRPEGTAKRNFRQHREKLIRGEDYFLVSQDFDGTKFVQSNQDNPRGGYRGDVIVITLSGYLMLVKSFNDPLAWELLRYLIQHYFDNRDLGAAEHVSRAIVALAETAERHEKKIDQLQMTLFEVKDRVIELAVDVDRFQPRKEITRKTKQEHRDVIIAHGGWCPCCLRVRLFDPSGNRLHDGEFDHFHHRSMPGPLDIWLICCQCHKDLTSKKLLREDVMTQFSRHQWLLQRRREDGVEQLSLFT